jgi:RecB family exonuclease
LRELGVEPVPIAGRVRRPLSAGSLAADLRATLIDPTSSPDLRATAAARLAALAALRTPEGRALVPAADPAHWWGMSDPTAAAAPLRDPEAPVDLSGSAVDGLNGCPLQWFLRREVRAEDAPTAALGFGNVLHALAEEVGRGAAADLPTLMARLDTVWAELSFDALWQSRDQREAARDALARFLQWHLGRPDRKLLGVEVPFELSLPVEGDRVRLRGRLDRVETDPHGQVWVVDLKTGKTPPTKEEMARHPQLGVYQAVVAAGGLAELPGAGDTCGGAEIVMLRQETGKTGLPKVHGQQSPASSDDPQWVAQMLSRAAARVRSEAFTPVPSEDCDRCPYRRCCPAQPEGAQVVS